MEYAQKHVFGATLHSWLASLTSGMRPVRRHQGDSSREDVLTHHCLRLFCEGWSSMNNAVASSHLTDLSSCLRTEERIGKKEEEEVLIQVCLHLHRDWQAALNSNGLFLFVVSIWWDSKIHSTYLRLCYLMGRGEPALFPAYFLFKSKIWQCPIAG